MWLGLVKGHRVQLLGQPTIITSEMGCCCIHWEDLTFLAHQTCARVAYPPNKPLIESGSVKVNRSTVLTPKRPRITKIHNSKACQS